MMAAGEYAQEHPLVDPSPPPLNPVPADDPSQASQSTFMNMEQLTKPQHQLHLKMLLEDGDLMQGHCNLLLRHP